MLDHSRRAAGASQVSRPNSSRAAGAGGSSNTMLKLYTDDSPGLRVCVTIRIFEGDCSHALPCLQRPLHRPRPFTLLHWFHLLPAYLGKGHSCLHEIILPRQLLSVTLSMKSGDWACRFSVRIEFTVRRCLNYDGEHGSMAASGIWIYRSLCVCIKSITSHWCTLIILYHSYPSEIQ